MLLFMFSGGWYINSSPPSPLSSCRQDGISLHLSRAYVAGNDIGSVSRHLVLGMGARQYGGLSRDDVLFVGDFVFHFWIA